MTRFILILILYLMTAQASFSQTYLDDTLTRTGIKLTTAFEQRGELLIIAKSERKVWENKFNAQKNTTDSVLYYHYKSIGEKNKQINRLVKINKVMTITLITLTAIIILK